MFLWKLLKSWQGVTAVIVASMGAIFHHPRVHQAVNVKMMKFFRDVGRYKALKRRRQGHGGGDQDASSSSSKGLLAFLADDNHRDPLQDLLDLNAETDEDELHVPTWTTDELWRLGNHDSDDGSILLAILGRVYDVTAGADKYYGPSAPYGMFAGHDVTYSLATGCKRPDCIGQAWTTTTTTATTTKDNVLVLTDAQLLEAKKWLSFFHLHDKYPLVGKLEGSSIDDLMEQLLLQQEMEEEAAAGQGQEEAPIVL